MKRGICDIDIGVNRVAPVKQYDNFFGIFWVPEVGNSAGTPNPLGTYPCQRKYGSLLFHGCYAVPLLQLVLACVESTHICFNLAFLRLVIGLKNSHSFLNQSD